MNKALYHYSRKKEENGQIILIGKKSLVLQPVPLAVQYRHEQKHTKLYGQSSKCISFCQDMYFGRDLIAFPLYGK